MTDNKTQSLFSTATAIVGGNYQENVNKSKNLPFERSRAIPHVIKPINRHSARMMSVVLATKDLYGFKENGGQPIDPSVFLSETVKLP
jgi:hypothetical protein